MSGSEQTNAFELYGVDGQIDDVNVHVTPWGDGVIITTQFVCGEDDVVFADTVMNAELSDLDELYRCIEKAVNFAKGRFEERLKNEGGKYHG